MIEVEGELSVEDVDKSAGLLRLYIQGLKISFGLVDSQHDLIAEINALIRYKSCSHSYVSQTRFIDNTQVGIGSRLSVRLQTRLNKWNEGVIAELGCINLGNGFSRQVNKITRLQTPATASEKYFEGVDALVC